MIGFIVLIKNINLPKKCKEDKIEDELDIIGNKFISGGNHIDAHESESEWVESDQTFEDIDDELNIDKNVQ